MKSQALLCIHMTQNYKYANGTHGRSCFRFNRRKASLEEIFAKLDLIRDNTYAYLIVEDLNNLVRGGRLTNGAALIAGLLKIKPILTFEDGKIVLFEKIRSTKKAFARAEKIIGERNARIEAPVKLYVIHANNRIVAEKEQAKLQKLYPNAESEIGHFGQLSGPT